VAGTTNNETVAVLGYKNADDGGGGMFMWNSTSTEADNGGTVISAGGSTGRWIRLYEGDLNVRWFGAIGDGTTNDSAAINDAFAALPVGGGGILFPNAVYRINQPVGCGAMIGTPKSIYVDLDNSTILVYGDGIGFDFSGTMNTTTQATAAYTEEGSKNSLVVQSVAGMSIGDLIHIVLEDPNDLYDTSRSYYYKGGNAVITKIDANTNTVYFNLTMPFDMLNFSLLNVEVYTPVSVSVYNGHIKGMNLLSASFKGVHISYGVNCTVDRICTDVFQYNIDFNRVVSGRITNCITGNAKNSDDDNWDGYGIVLGSVNSVTVANCMVHSGQHGITTGGGERGEDSVATAEPCYGVRIRDCVVKAEIWGLAIGLHENIWDCFIENCRLFGFMLAGNVRMTGCEMMKSEISLKIALLLTCAEKNRNANYSFVDCRFNSQQVRLEDHPDTACPTRKYVGRIAFERCGDFRTMLNVRKQTGEDPDHLEKRKTAEVHALELRSCNFDTIDIYDNLQNLLVADSESDFNSNVIVNPATDDGVHSEIGLVKIVNCRLPKRYDIINLIQCGTVIINGFAYNEYDYVGTGYDEIRITDTENIHFANIDMTGSVGGVALVASLISFSDCKLRFKYDYGLASLLSNANIAHVDAKGLYLINDGKMYDIQNKLMRGQATAAPTGTTVPWRKGDILYNAAVAASGPLGWVCTAAGAPGTWTPITI